jgi:hypothetical protein
MHHRHISFTVSTSESHLPSDPGSRFQIPSFNFHMLFSFLPACHTTRKKRLGKAGQITAPYRPFVRVSPRQPGSNDKDDEHTWMMTNRHPFMPSQIPRIACRTPALLCSALPCPALLCFFMCKSACLQRMDSTRAHSTCMRILLPCCAAAAA